MLTRCTRVMGGGACVLGQRDALGRPLMGMGMGMSYPHGMGMSHGMGMGMGMSYPIMGWGCPMGWGWGCPTPSPLHLCPISSASLLNHLIRVSSSSCLRLLLASQSSPCRQILVTGTALLTAVDGTLGTRLKASTASPQPQMALVIFRLIQSTQRSLLLLKASFRACSSTVESHIRTLIEFCNRSHCLL